MRSSIHLSLLAAWLLAADSVNAQLAVTVAPVKVIGHKAVVPLALKNEFDETITGNDDCACVRDR